MTRMDLDLRLVRYFVAVADELHFGRAAANLYISQPALSKQIRKLEEQVGAPLLVRDTRHVTLTPRGQRFLDDARQLLAIAASMAQPPRGDIVRIAHIFELDTSRLVADDFMLAHPDVEVLEHAMDSISQLEALLANRLDLAILRVTPRMLAEHPNGWRHQPLRLEPLLLVGAPGDVRRQSASLYERPLHVFGDPPESGRYNAHGQYLTAFEEHFGLTMHWLGTPGAFSHCLVHVSRATTDARYLEFSSYAERYAGIGLPVYQPQEAQPVYPWSVAWRDTDPSPATHALVRSAIDLSRKNHWLTPETAHGARTWLPAGEPVGAPLIDASIPATG